MKSGRITATYETHQSMKRAIYCEYRKPASESQHKLYINGNLSHFFIQRLLKE